MKLANLLINKRLFLLDYGFRNRCKIDEMKEEISETDHAALAILKKTGLDVVEAAQLAHELLQASKGRGSRWEGKGMHPAGRGSPGCQRKNRGVQESRG